MPLTFYPYEEDIESSSMQEKIELLLDAAERYKAIVLETAAKPPETNGGKRRGTPKDISAAFNWGEIAKLLREIRELPEANQVNKIAKAEYLTKLAEIYESLRAAKMAKLEAVRLALINEASQLRSGGGSQVA